MRNLLIGNGLNLTNYEENNFLISENIYLRFIKNLNDYWNIMNELVALNNIDLEKLLLILNKNDGIEKLAGKVFQYFYNEITLRRNFSWNDGYRLIEILGEISIKSIFFKNDNFLIPKIANEYKNKIEKTYNNVFTLNYIEDWDECGIVKYLHGNLIQYVTDYCDIGSNILSHNKKYSNFKANEYKKIDFKDIVFMPTNDYINKYNYIVKGLYPRDDLFPADDLFTYGGRDIYKDLNELENIDIFGMSPDGDEAIIKKISKIKDKRIYVYKLNKDEINKWKSYNIDDCFIDSSKFLCD